MKKTSFLVFLCTLLMTYSCNKADATDKFVRVNNGSFEINKKPYYFIGTNFWYGAILGSKGTGGDRERLLKELDFMKENGINNLRVLVGGDGKPGVATRIEPTLQVAPRVYNDTIFDGLDYLLAEMAKRDMYAVLYLNNSWEWSGGYSQYLQWSGHGEIPIPMEKGWNEYMAYVEGYMKSDSAKAMFANHVKKVIDRTNRYTKVEYKNDPTIMSWQIGNEPRAFSDENKESFAAWIKDVAVLIKSLDSNHLVSVGSEGERGCENDINLWTKIHTYPEINYATMHLWPYDWGWVDNKDIAGTIKPALEKVAEYINKHIAIAETLKKPIVLEEFGLPRDGFGFSPSASTDSRDLLYAFIFERIEKSAEKKGTFGGCNFWAWGGFGRATEGHVFWKVGDNYLGDPAQEEQGLNSVFDTDSTIGLIKQSTDKIARNRAN